MKVTHDCPYYLSLIDQYGNTIKFSDHASIRDACTEWKRVANGETATLLGFTVHVIENDALVYTGDYQTDKC